MKNLPFVKASDVEGVFPWDKTEGTVRLLSAGQ